MGKARLSDYRRMAVAASEVVVRTRNGSYGNRGRSGQDEFVLVDFPASVKFAPGFPRGVIVERNSTTNAHKINAVKLLDWLHERGYSSYSAKQLVQQTKDYERLEASIEKMFAED